MFDHLFYQDKGAYLQVLHPVTQLVYLGVLLFLALVFQNPLYLAGLLLVSILVAGTAGGLRQLAGFFQGVMGLVVFIIIINPFLSRAGATVIWKGPWLPVIGRPEISLEAIFYSGVMGLKLIAIISVFCLYNLIVHPDKLLGLTGRFAFKSTLVLVLATRMFPVMLRRLSSIREVQTMRGVDFENGSLRERFRRYADLLNILLLSSLEDAFAIAEAMQARAFASGRRSAYSSINFRPGDCACILATMLALAAGLYGHFKAYSAFTFYPRLGVFLNSAAVLYHLAIVMLLLAVPALLGWGWRHCPCIKSKI